MVARTGFFNSPRLGDATCGALNPNRSSAGTASRTARRFEPFANGAKQRAVLEAVPGEERFGLSAPQVASPSRGELKNPVLPLTITTAQVHGADVPSMTNVTPILEIEKGMSRRNLRMSNDETAFSQDGA